MQARQAIPRVVLADRTPDGITEPLQYGGGGEHHGWNTVRVQQADDLQLTEAGEALGPVLRELCIWGETYAR